MLVENGLEGPDIAWSVVGIGINLNQTEFPGEVMNATSLKRLTGHSFEPASFLEKVCRGLEALLPALDTQEGRNGLLAGYERDLFQKDSPAPYRDNVTGEEFTGVIRGITPEGLLRIEKAEGPEKTFGFKEVSYIL
jgi:BirA family biotin operon repressor/biotin-[acetyl-CoA-carboxylase] ligase